MAVKRTRTYLLRSAQENYCFSLAEQSQQHKTICTVLSLLQTICQHIAVEDLLQLFALFAVSNIPLVRFQQFCGIFLTEIRCLQCLQITGIHLKHNFVSLFAGKWIKHPICVFISCKSLIIS